MRSVTVRQALQQVADYPNPVDDEMIRWPVHEHVARTLYAIANDPNVRSRGSMTRANRARKMILNRMVGKRRAGSHPATRTTVAIDFMDLTGEKEKPDDAAPDPEPESL